MDTLEKIKELCRQKNITVQQLEIEIREKPSSIAKISSNSKAEKLYKIAKYFGVSIEYLITEEETKAQNERLSFLENELIRSFWDSAENIQQSICVLLEIDFEEVRQEKKERITA